MGRLITAIYSDTGPGMPNAPKSGVSSSIQIGARQLVCIRVKSSSEGTLKQLIVLQTAGPAVAFTVELLASKLPYPPGLMPDTAVSAVPIQLYRVMAPISAGAGSPAELAPDYQQGWPFHNVDGDYTMNERYIYLVIIPTGSVASTKWDVSVIMETQP
jgi:hypothetical protein